MNPPKKAAALRGRAFGRSLAGFATMLAFVGLAPAASAQIRIPMPGAGAPVAVAPGVPVDAPTSFALGEITVEYPWTRSTFAGRDTPVFLRIVNAGAADRLMEVRANVGWSTELVEILLTGGRFRMIPTGALEVPAAGALDLSAPDGGAIGLRNLFADLPAGTVVPLTLSFEHAGDLEVVVAVEAPDAMKHSAAP